MQDVDILYLNGYILIKSNIAKQNGGGMYLDSDSIFISENVKLNILNNTAYINGGGMWLPQYVFLNMQNIM